MAGFFESFVLKCFDYVSNIFDFADTPVLNEFGNKDTAEILSQVDDGKEKPLYRDPLFLITVSVTSVFIAVVIYYYFDEITVSFENLYESFYGSVNIEDIEPIVSVYNPTPVISPEMELEFRKIQSNINILRMREENCRIFQARFDANKLRMLELTGGYKEISEFQLLRIPVEIKARDALVREVASDLHNLAMEMDRRNLI